MVIVAMGTTSIRQGGNAIRYYCRPIIDKHRFSQTEDCNAYRLQRIKGYLPRALTSRPESSTCIPYGTVLLLITLGE